ncbi:hypothetical protein BH10PLA1_BH10PLA1_04140 [soil metagenome]
MQTAASGPQFGDIQTLLERSEPRPRVNWFWYGVGAFLLVSLIGAYISQSSPTGRALVEGGSVLLTIGVIGGMSLFTFLTLRQMRDAQLQIEAAAELVQLRRWPQAHAMLEQILSQPVRTHAMRFEALIYLTSVLARYDRFEDALAVQDHLLATNRVDATTERAIKLGRAMAMLRLDRLFDADRAIADLRRGEARDQSGGLALIEIYRDVKTGHPAEAIDIFKLRKELMRDQLGHRVADAYALVAKSHDQLDQPTEAQGAFTSATQLSTFDELVRRYPELADLPAKYQMSAAPDAGRTPPPLGGVGSALADVLPMPSSNTGSTKTEDAQPNLGGGAP